MNERPEVRVLVELVQSLNLLGIDYVLGGSFASGTWGQPRYTNDIDVAIYIDTTHVGAMVEAFRSNFLVSESEFLDALASDEEYRSAQLLHLAELFKIDVFLPRPSAYAESVQLRARTVAVAGSVQCRCLSPEDTVIHKLRWYELGNRVSDRQWNDIVQVIEVQGSHLDREYVRQWARHFGLSELVEEAFSEALPP